MVSRFEQVASEVLREPPVFAVEFENKEDSLAVHAFTVTERISEPFVVVLSARSPHVDIDFQEIVGHGAAFAYRSEDTQVVGWTGICTHMEQVQAEVSQTGLSTYRITIRPTFWLLTQRRTHRIFQHLGIPDIVKKILGEYTIEARWDTSDTYPKHEYEVQYGESDFDFVSRLLEEAGISYYFEREVSEVKAKSRLVFSDHPQKNPSLGDIDFYDQPNDSRNKKFVTNVRISHDVKPGKTTLRDYDLRKPEFDLTAESRIKLSGDEALEEKYEQYRYEHGISLIEVASGDGGTPVADKFSFARWDRDEETARAQRAAEAERWQKRYVELDSNQKHLCPGQVFGIAHHPHEDLAPGKHLLAVEISIHANSGDWGMAVTAVFTEPLRYRPALRTPKPRAVGLQTAIVVGPPGKEIHTDEFGRVRVRFHWDREGASDDSATCWLRVSQQWAGAGFGWLLVPRVGHEVIVDYFGGDPNQPVIVGRLHNSTTTVPRSLPKAMTQSIWRSQTSPFTDGSFNEIMMEDEAGKELVFVQAQRDLLKLVKHDETERTGRDRNIVVGAARVAAIAKNDSHQVGKQYLIKVVSAGDLHIPDMGDPEITPRTTLFEAVDGKITLTTGEATVVLDGGKIGIDASGGLRFSSDGVMILEGSDIYLNDKSGSVSKGNPDKKLVDPVKKPDRMLKPIEALLWDKQLARQAAIDDIEAELPGGKPTPPPPKSQRFKKNGEITDEYYEYLRDRTPTKALRKTVNEGEKPLKCPLYETEEDPLEADHIVPMLEIVGMPGFNELTPEQHLDILNLEKNFWGLGKSANCSKGGKSMEEWLDGGALQGVTLKDENAAEALERDKKARKAITAAIEKARADNKKSS
jgi:type VI secretion system secreted protein VgrG